MCIHCVDNILWRFRNDLYLGDQPIVLDRSERQIAKDRLKALERIDDLKKRRKTKEGKRRKKKRKRPAQAKSSRLPTATRLNETVVSQLDVSCFERKILGKGLIKAPLIEHTRPAKYARFVAAPIETAARFKKKSFNVMKRFILEGIQDFQFHLISISSNMNRRIFITWGNL